jgi:hypothetical protein
MTKTKTIHLDSLYRSTKPYVSDSRFRSPDPHGVEELIKYMLDLSQRFGCGWRSGIEHALWYMTSAWALRRERIAFPYDDSADGEDAVTTVLDSAYLERLAFLARWTDGWIFHVSVETPHPSVPWGFHGPIYVTQGEWRWICEARLRDARAWDLKDFYLETVK